ncbi:MAG: hypothetical protein JNJ45_07885 [Chthonomonas sp.]|nr:hypothetical protein [Chthonomonas sp.]
MSKKKLHYLTVQDLLFVNLQVDKKVNTFDFAALEDASFFQYGYGQSTDILTQASRFYRGFLEKAPFTAGNEGTALVGALTFLAINGYTLKGRESEAPARLTELSRDLISYEDIDEHGEPDIHGAIADVMSRYGKVLKNSAVA